MRVSGVRRSCETPASISVRWVIWRCSRSRILMKARAAWRTSVAPSGLKLGTSRPLPKRSAATARRCSERTWLRMKTEAMVSSTSDEPAIHRMKSVEVGVERRFLGTAICMTPFGISTETSRSRGSKSPSICEGPVDALDHGLGELLLGAAAGRALQPGRQCFALAEGIDQLGDIARLREQQVALGAVVGGAQRIEGEADIAGDGGGEPAHDRVPDPVVEEPGRDQLEQHHRQDDDEQRAAPERARQRALEPAAMAVGRCGR